MSPNRGLKPLLQFGYATFVIEGETSRMTARRYPMPCNEASPAIWALGTATDKQELKSEYFVNQPSAHCAEAGLSEVAASDYSG